MIVEFTLLLIAIILLIISGAMDYVWQKNHRSDFIKMNEEIKDALKELRKGREL